MTLQNLLSINKLQSFTPDRGAVQKLLRAAQRNLEDARLTALSADNRFCGIQNHHAVRDAGPVGKRLSHFHQPARSSPDRNPEPAINDAGIKRDGDCAGCLAQAAKLE